MDTIGVSIICNAYNHEKYIAKALDGFIMQKTNFKIEILIHDDASTDRTTDIIREYESKYPHIIKPIYQTENQYSKNVKVGVIYQYPRAKGKYIALCEGDDYWTDEFKLQKQYDYMEQNEKCTLVGHKSWTHYLDIDKYVPFTRYNFDKKKKYDFSTEEIVHDHLLLHTSSMFFRRSDIEKIWFFLENVSSYDYVMKILLAANGYVHIIPEYMSVYNKGVEGSWSVRISKINENYKKHVDKAISTLERLNEYTSYKYDSCFKNNILKRRFQLLEVTCAIDEMKREPYIELYRKLPMVKKILLYTQKYMPGVYEHIQDHLSILKAKVKKCLYK